MEDNNYKDKLYNILSKEYNRSLKNIPIYIIWDRDPESNDEEIVFKLLNTFTSAQDNNYEMNGLLLLSYPCIETYEISNFDKKLWKTNFTSSFETKKKMKTMIPNISNINEKTLLLATFNMHKTMETYGINNYEPSNFKKENLKILKKRNRRI